MTTKTQTPAEPQPKTETPAETQPDTEAILPVESDLMFGGMPCTVRRLRTREFIALMRVLTSGLGPGLATVRLDFTSTETVASDLSALMLLAIPAATDEAMLFLATMVEAKDKDQQGDLNKYALDNPELEEMLDVIERVIAQEADQIFTLAGKAQAMWTRIAPMFQNKKTAG